MNLGKINPLCQECQEVEAILGVDMTAVLERLAEMKGSTLADREQVYFCLSLRGYSSYAIAFRWFRHQFPKKSDLESKEPAIEKKARNLRSDMAKTVHGYIEGMMGEEMEDARKSPWIKILNFLRESGFAKPPLTDLDEAMEKGYLEIPINANQTVEQISEQLAPGLKQLQERLGGNLKFSIKVIKFDHPDE
jgi:hypothetical protein